MSDRAYLVGLLTKTAEPVLAALADGELRLRMPVHPWEENLAPFTHLEAFARTLAGIAPWLELGPDDTAEGRRRTRFLDLARRSLVSATDPASPDAMRFDGSHGSQPLVEAAFLAAGLLRAPGQLWEPLTARQRADALDALRASRQITAVPDNNWQLFPAMVEAALWTFGDDPHIARITDAVARIEAFYVGDGTYADGAEFHWDHYNSFVIHPMLLQVLRVAATQGHPVADEALPRALRRAERYAVIQERLVSPEGTIPIVGRSAAYRFAALHHLAATALHRDLPTGLDPGAARSAMTAVIRRMAEAPGTFDDEGWLRVGVVGHQPSAREGYISTGSLYLCLTGLVHLGLPADDPFWTAPAAAWTQQRIWSGQDMPRDEALHA